MATEQAPDQQSRTSDSILDDIVAELDQEYTGQLPKRAIRAAQRRREEITSRLIDVLRKATEAAQSGNSPRRNGHLFALFLLTEFGAKDALPAILEAVSLPGEGPFDLFGDAITEDLRRVLAALAESPDVLDGLIANRSLNEYVRWEAAQAYLLLVRDGRLTRDQAVERLRKHLREAIANRDREIASGLISELESYAPHEALEEIMAAFRSGLVDESIVHMKEIKQSIAEGRARFEEALESCRPTGVADTVDELSGWAAFEQPDRHRGNSSRGAKNCEIGPPETLAGPSRRFDEIAVLPDPFISEDGFSDLPQMTADAPAATIRHAAPRIGRNDRCPCGSGKKYKKCCGPG